MKCCRQGLMGDSRGGSWKIRVESNVYSGGPAQEVSKGKKDSLGTRLETTHVIFGKDSSCLLSMFGELA